MDYIFMFLFENMEFYIFETYLDTMTWALSIPVGNLDDKVG